MKKNRTALLLFLLVSLPGLPAAKIKTLHGVSPLKDDLNRDKDQVRVLFFGSPT